MPKIKVYQTEDLTAGGGTINLPADGSAETYVLTSSGTVVLAGNWVVQASGTPVTGTEYRIQYEASLTLGLNTLTIFGTSIPADLALRNFEVIAYYNGSTWVTKILIDVTALPFVSDDMIESSAVTTAKIADSNVTTAKIADSNVTTAKIADSNVTTAKIADSNVTTAKIADSNVTLAKLETALKTYDIVVPLSFETNEQAYNEIQIDHDFTLVSINFSVTKAIAGTDDGTVSFYIDGSPTVAASKTFTASTAINTADSITFSSANTGSSGQKIRLRTAKVTAGGKVLATLKITRR